MKRYIFAWSLCSGLLVGTALSAQTPVQGGSVTYPPGTYPAQNAAPQNGAGQPAAQAPGNFQMQNSAAGTPGATGSGQFGANDPASQVPLDQIPPVDQTLINGLAPAGQNGAVDTAHQTLFRAALDSVFPFSPDEIQQIFDKMHENQSATAIPTMGNPKAEVKAETIPLEPGAEPRTIELDTGYVTTVSFLDSSGNPWPIQDIGVGGNFDVPAPDEGGNVIRMTALSKYALGNMSIRLVGLTSPLSFKLKATTGRVFYRYDARIPRSGPRASAPLIEHGNDLVAGDTLLMGILDGAPPMNSTRLTVNGVDSRTEAWRLGEKVYVRTPYTLLSPGWDGSVGSGDGTRVYLIADTPVLLLSDNGNLIHARLGNNARTDEQPVPSIEDGLAHPLRASAASESSQGTHQLITRSSDQSSSNSSGSSRTLIRPVQVGGTGQNPAGQPGYSGGSNLSGSGNAAAVQGGQP